MAQPSRYVLTRTLPGAEPVSSFCSPEQAANVRCILFASDAVGSMYRHGDGAWEIIMARGETLLLQSRSA